ncbi:hypothetical protein PRZ48_006486 [Zasmidium cellare]|uniref:DUF8212 domain-containing protein n=1 Tax=Zasmidium cellare TaxID=395010 RepID=A0ABR0EN84_ZASCE|nr:hypothetical protein PRZ48_006486 [Zasmidium cellare]
MYVWYWNAYRCYAYLSDVGHAPDVDNAFLTPQQLDTSEWFTRGWTLQELLAPQTVIFVDDEWQIIGHKCCLPCWCMSETRYALKQDLGHLGPILNEQLTEITGIDGEFLERCEKIQTASIARRISWASKRKTTRIEDMAYCLLGLLRVNMPLLYGEGETAFCRLQEELIKRSTDQSIFAWTLNEAEYGHIANVPKVSGIFAHSPADFEKSGSVCTTGADTWPYTMTNTGLHLRTVARRSRLARKIGRYGSRGGQEIFVIRLNCRLETVEWTPSKDSGEPIDIVVAECPRPFQGLAHLRRFQRIHDFGRMLADSCPIGPPEDVNLYVRTFNHVEVLRWLDPDPYYP